MAIISARTATNNMPKLKSNPTVMSGLVTIVRYFIILGESQLTCPAHQCRSFIEDEVIIQLFNDPGNPDGQMIVNQYKNLMIDSFVSQHRLVNSRYVTRSIYKF